MVHWTPRYLRIITNSPLPVPSQASRKTERYRAPPNRASNAVRSSADVDPRPGIHRENLRIAALPLRSYLPGNPIVLFLHQARASGSFRLMDKPTSAEVTDTVRNAARRDKADERSDQDWEFGCCPPQHPIRQHDPCRYGGAWIGSANASRAGAAADARTRNAWRPQAKHPLHHGRRYRLVQCQRLQYGDHGLSHAQYRQDRQGRCSLHRLVWPAKLHRRSRCVHHRPVADPHRSHQGRPTWRAARAQPRRSERGGCDEVARLCDRPIRQEPSGRPQ